MADNYLEKQYESHEARRATWEREKKYGSRRSKVKKSKTREQKRPLPNIDDK